MMSKSKLAAIIVIFISFTILSCGRNSSYVENYRIDINVDGQLIVTNAFNGETVKDLLIQEGIQLQPLDRSVPSLETKIDREMSITLIRVEENFILLDEEIPFQEIVVQNESLEEGESYLIQQGRNGIKQTTYRVIKENNTEKMRTIFSESTILEPVAEILMVGISKPFVSIPIPGKLAYLIAGNAWAMESNTSNRRPVTQSNDLDGRIFEISPDGKWLLFSRTSGSDEDTINSLWIASLDTDEVILQDLNVKNVIHHAAWVPGKTNTVTYSTVEPRETPPGWQANNDLWVLTFSEGGSVWRNENVIAINGGGEYGWWGTDYFWSPDGSTLVYSRPDQIGFVNFQSKTLVPLIELNAFNTRGDWAWYSSIGWSPGSKVFFWQDNASGSSSINQSFSMNSFHIDTQDSINLIENPGMFSYPSPAPMTSFGHYYLGFLQSIQNNQSDTSRYRLIISEQDGSNSRSCFPPQNSIGLEPQLIQWSPAMNNDGQFFIGVILDGNLWFIDAVRCESLQITSDGLISKIDWR